MRTVILNTLGSELRQTSLFYLPFREEQFQWVDVALPHIGDAAEKICAHSSNQGQVQDYHLIVLVSLSRYRHCRYERLREVCKDVLKTHIHQALVLPLAQKQCLPPAAVSIVYVTPNSSDGDGNVPDEEVFDALLGFADKDEVTSLVVTSDDGEQVDVSAHFSDILQDYAFSRSEEIKKAVDAEQNRSRKNLRAAIKERVGTLCICRYSAPGEDRMRIIPSESVDFFPKTTNWELFSVDLQINLSDHLADAINGSHWHLVLCPHEEKDIQQRISLALHRVRCLRNSTDSVTYHPMEPLTDTLEADALPGSIWAKLQEAVEKGTTLPGVADLREIMNETYDPELVPVETEDEKTTVKLRGVWLLLGLAKKKFEEQCRKFAEEYNSDAAKEQQMIVLDTCTEVFRDWRVRMLRREEEGLSAPTLPEMPTYDPRKAREELEKAQKEYGEVCVERLEDYEDLRKEAEEIKAKFRQDTRLWSKEGPASTGWFLLYSTILALLFLLQMILPFVGITVETASAQLSGYIHLGISIAVFAGLYVAGVIVWIRALCARVNKHTVALATLVYRSQLRRRQSILDAVDTYGKHLPACMIKYENLKRLERIYAANLLRKSHYHTHVQILDKAEEILLEMHTLLRLPQDVTVADDHRPKKKIDYQRAPSDPENVPLYIFLSEKWGGD